MQIFKSNDWKWLLLNILICFLMVYSINGIYFIRPNDFMHAFGGDALVIYYNVAYHICYGNGDVLTSMNYPEGESIFLTDAQGSLSILLQWINSHVVNISSYAVGIINWLNAISILICSAIVHLVLRELKVNALNATLFSPLITVMSPQIFRMNSHFGLSYLFIIPLVFWWVLRKTKKPEFHYSDILFFLYLIGLTFNNPYTGFISCSIIIFSGLYLWVKSRFNIFNLYISAIGIFSILIPFIYFKMFDPVDDRIKIQWGFFEYKASILGYISPDNTLVSDVVKLLGFKVKNIQFEAIMYIGIVSLVLLLAFLTISFLKTHTYRFKTPVSFYPLIFSAIMLFLYSSGTFFLPFNQDTMEDKFSVLLMFKAVGRLGWPLYFVFTILSVLFFDNMLKKLPKWIAIISTILAFVVWHWDLNSYVKPSFKNNVHENFFKDNQLTKINDVLKQKNIDKDSFQAILSLPKLMAWNDNFISDFNWSAQFNGMRISLATGLPIVNAMLSRMSISQVAERIELLANPIIYKSLPDKFPNQKDLLIVLGYDYPPLTIGENFLIEISDTLYHEPNSYTLLRLPISKINDNKYRLSARQMIGDTSHLNVDHFYNGFENESNNISYFGSSSKRCLKGDTEIFFDTIINPLSDKYVFSVWTRADHQKYGMGAFTCEVKNLKGDIIFKEGPDTRKSNEVHGVWVRTELSFPVENMSTVSIKFNSNKEIFIDELLIRPDTSIIIFQDYDKKEMLYNGFRIQ